MIINSGGLSKSKTLHMNFGQYEYIEMQFYWLTLWLKWQILVLDLKCIFVCNMFQLHVHCVILEKHTI